MGKCVQGGGSPLLRIELTGDWVRKARKGLLEMVEFKMNTGIEVQV